MTINVKTWYVLFVKSTQSGAGAWVSFRNRKNINAVSLLENSSHYETKEEAEGAALIVASLFPHVIGRIEIMDNRTARESDFLFSNWHDFTVNANG